jgi:hypothetical protein
MWMAALTPQHLEQPSLKVVQNKSVCLELASTLASLCESFRLNNIFPVWGGLADVDFVHGSLCQPVLRFSFHNYTTV